MTTTPDPYDVLVRADNRWAKRHSDDPAPAEYLRALLTALAPLLQPGAAPIDLDQATELEQQRLQLEAANSRNEVLEEQLDDTHQLLITLATAAAGGWDNDLDTADQVQTALTRIRQQPEQPQRDPELERQLDEARAERDTARAEHRDIQGDVERLLATIADHEHTISTTAADNTKLADQLAAVQVDLARERLLGHLKTAADDVEAGRVARQATLEQLGRLVDAINEQWLPDGDVTAQVDHAIQLVIAACEVIDQHQAAGKHICAWPRDPHTGRISKCGCGKPFPKTAKTSLTGATKGAA